MGRQSRDAKSCNIVCGVVVVVVVVVWDEEAVYLQGAVVSGREEGYVCWLLVVVVFNRGFWSAFAEVSEYCGSVDESARQRASRDRDCVVSPVDIWVVEVEPWSAEDNVVGSGVCDIQRDTFFVIRVIYGGKTKCKTRVCDEGSLFVCC
jgi:hypothetical protein